MWLLRPSIFLLCFLLFPLSAFAQSAPARVIAVADGDTITVLTTTEQQIKIRLYGIDCPESKQAFGNRARQATSKAVAGKNVDILPIDEDRYGRTVALVFADGESLNEILVRDGMAWVYTAYCKQEAICEPLKELEKTARAQRNGLWADKAPVPPWEWRKESRKNR